MLQSSVPMYRFVVQKNYLTKWGRPNAAAEEGCIIIAMVICRQQTSEGDDLCTSIPLQLIHLKKNSIHFS